jgi:hypothetical protein
LVVNFNSVGVAVVTIASMSYIAGGGYSSQ